MGSEFILPVSIVSNLNHPLFLVAADINKSSPDSGHPDDMPPSADKQFYENLPFRGLKKPPPQTEETPLGTAASSTSTPKFHNPSTLESKSSDICPSRPSSQLSTNGSSGYGSTRSKSEQKSSSSKDPPDHHSSSSSSSS